ncbi:phosphomannomutase 45a [Anaeramoeba flamelloides]|uniref:Phosphomannomutase 45a n=1 Tax=Anaeramoeba flamelloides TaxID=1746091 RepID=A0AAV7ZMI1_9EUKA|nr:phosphomannomutase 45a [Anaeramoeba flamelloides]
MKLFEIPAISIAVSYKAFSDSKKTIFYNANEWLKIDKNEETRSEIQDLLQNKDEKTLHQLFDGRIEFGTAGLRAKMGAGYTKMNHITVQQTAQGWSEYLLEEFGEEGQKKGIVIGYDHRHHSREYADITAKVFMLKGFKVYCFNQIVPTPLLSFAVRVLGTVGGVMVTPSHNPKEYNGYKIYWENSVQIIPPHDSNISQKIQENLKLLDLEESEKLQQILLFDPIETNQIDEQYYDKIFEELQPKKSFGLAKKTELKVTYTAMHGVGYEWVKRAFSKFDYPDLIPVPEQVKPDPEFPTIQFPNPAEKRALDLAISIAEENGSNLILANDPDADRLCVAERITSSTDHNVKTKNEAQWYKFHGNEIGILFAWWEYKKYKQVSPSNEDLVAVLTSTVSSKMLKAFANHYGFLYEETLTGFKWLGNKAIELEKEGYKILLAFEESIGYMIGNTVFDKDGISAPISLTQMAQYLYNKNSTLKQQFEKLSNKLGYFLFKNSYFYCYDKDVLNHIFKKIRNNGNYFEKIGQFSIKSIRDLTTGFDNSKPNNKADLFVDPNSQMITFTLENDAVITLRTSGTEPKIKYYIEYSGKESREKIQQKLEILTRVFIQTCIEPELNNLVAPKKN